MQEQLIIDRSTQKSSVAGQVAGAGIKTILFHVHHDDGLEARLQFALSVARACGAHLHLLHVVPLQAYSVIDAFGAFVSGEIIDAMHKDADDLRLKLEAQLTSEDVSWDYEDVTGELMPHLIHCASLADLIIVGRERAQPEFAGPTINMVGDLLHEARTPLLIIGEQPKSFDPFGTAVIAWNGSYEAANTVRATVGLLRLASDVRVLSIEEDRPGMFPSTRAPEYLSRHGIHAELVVRPRSATSLSENLITYAQANEAAYIVMGGYSHSRAGEYLFGGTTRDLLTDCPVTLVMGR